MDDDELDNLHFQITTYRSGEPVIIETANTEAVARTRFTSAVDLCRSLDNSSSYSVELRDNARKLLEIWPSV